MPVLPRRRHEIGQPVSAADSKTVRRDTARFSTWNGKPPGANRRGRGM